MDRQTILTALQRYINNHFYPYSRGIVKDYYVESGQNPEDPIFCVRCAKTESQSSPSAYTVYRIRKSQLQAEGFLQSERRL